MAGLQPEAERAGFEPATDLSARTRFPVALLRPLGHLSELGAEYPGKTVAWIIDHFRPARHDPKVCSAVKSASDQKGSR